MEKEKCGARFPIEISGWGSFVCSLPAGHDGEHFAELKIAKMMWFNEEKNRQISEGGPRAKVKT